MTPVQVLESYRKYGSALGTSISLPRVYRGMSREFLLELAEEYERPSIDDRLHQQSNRNNWPASLREVVAKAEADATAAWKAGLLPMATDEATPADPEGAAVEAEVLPRPSPPPAPLRPFDRAIARGDRLTTPARRRVAFLHHLRQCRTLMEAAARTGVDRRTIGRWRETSPAFAARCDAIVVERRRQAIEDAVMAAEPETQAVFHRGKKVGEITKRDRALSLYLLKQADAEALRAEKRREREVDLEALVQQRVQQELARLAAGSARAREEVSGEEEREPISEMSHSAGHRAGEHRAEAHRDVPIRHEVDPQDPGPATEPAFTDLALLGPALPRPARQGNDGSPPLR